MQRARTLMTGRLKYRLWGQTYNMLWATMKQYIAQGLYSDSRVLDIRHVEVSPLSPYNQVSI